MAPAPTEEIETSTPSSKPTSTVIMPVRFGSSSLTRAR